MGKRDKALTKLLEPIEWGWDSSIRARQNLVVARRQEVRTVYPFLTKDEKVRADKWLEDNAFRGLWD